MQRVILTGMFFLFASVAVNAEVVQSVNFNPARFGQYERLKVSDKATFLGGMSAQSMRVQSGGTVTINESPSNGQGRLVYDILKLDATKGSLSGGDTFPGDPTLNFPNTCFGSVDNCVTSSATGNLDVSFQNGKARFQAPASYTDNASRINQITTQADQLRIEAIYATIKGKLNVTGNGAYSFRNMGADIPLRLAGNWIPLPSMDQAPQNATLKWENRTTVKYADHGGETVRILVLDGGTTGGGGGCTPTNGNSYTGTCPAGQTGSITYTWNQAQCKYITSSTCTAVQDKTAVITLSARESSGGTTLVATLNKNFSHPAITVNFRVWRMYAPTEGAEYRGSITIPTGSTSGATQIGGSLGDRPDITGITPNPAADYTLTGAVAPGL